MLIAIVSLAAFATGFIVSWFLVQHRAELAAERARSETRVEVATLKEKLTSSTAETLQLQGQMVTAAQKQSELQQQLEDTRSERARLEERAIRVPELQSQIGRYAEEATQLAARSAAFEREASRVTSLEEKLAAVNEENDHLRAEMTDVRVKLGTAESTMAAQIAQIDTLQTNLSQLASRYDVLQTQEHQLKTQYTALTTTLESERQQTQEKLALVTEAKEQLTATFKSLASEIFEEKSQKFTEQNKVKIAEILDPFRTRLSEFQNKVDQVYVQDSSDRAALSEQVRQLMSLNQRLSQDADNLVRAFKGSNKTQGNWGEMILERVLETSGLVKDREYLIRPTYDRQDGGRAQPDSVVILPENRHLIIDAKVSIVAYETYANTDNDQLRSEALSEHVASVREHIRDLASQGYQSLPELRSLDFVVMFVPIEPAFITAVAADPKLWQEAWQKNILLVSPSSFLFVVRIVANLWRQEVQKRSIQEIFKRGAEMYDKLVGFVDDLAAVGNRIAQAKEYYDSAFSKLSTGRGNVIRQAEMLKSLGLKPNKSLPLELVETADDDVPLLAEAATASGPSSEDAAS